MRITIVQGAFLPVPPLLGGAVEKVWLGLGQEFARRGHEVVHISRQHPDLPHENEENGVRYRRVPGFDTPASLFKLKWLDLRYSLRAKRILTPADILVTNTFWLPFLIKHQRFGHLYVHAQRYPKGQYRFYRHAARLQTVSNVIANAIRAEVPDLDHKIKIIGNPLPADFEIQPPRPLVTNGEAKFLFVGRIHPEKGIDILLEAFRLLESRSPASLKLRLDIIGPHEVAQGGGGADFLAKLQAQARNLKSPVKWHGPVFDAAMLQQAYREADFLVYPSIAGKGEASPLTPVEAMSQACLPITSNLECFADYLKPGENGFTFALERRAESLAETMAQACNHSDLPALVKNALATAKRYRVPHIADEYLQDFARLPG